MAIMAEPCEVFRNVIRPVPIFMMHCNYSLIPCPTHLAHFGTSSSTERCRVSRARVPTFPTLMSRTRIDLIPPQRLATFPAEEFLVFRDAQKSRLAVNFLSAGTTKNHLPRSHRLVVANARAKLPVTAQDKIRFSLEFFFTNYATSDKCHGLIMSF